MKSGSLPLFYLVSLRDVSFCRRFYWLRKWKLFTKCGITLVIRAVTSLYTGVKFSIPVGNWHMLLEYIGIVKFVAFL